MDPWLEEQFQRAIDLRHEGRYEESREIWEVLRERYPEMRGPISWMLAGVFLDLKRPAEGIPYALEAVQEAPASFNVSLSLFHCLWGAGRPTDAFDEMVRFLSLQRCQHYEELAEGLLSESSELSERVDGKELQRALAQKLSTLEWYADRFEEGDRK
jgi:hypothetical protein